MTADPEEQLSSGSNVSLITELIDSEMKNIGDEPEKTSEEEAKTGGLIGLREELQSRADQDGGGTKPPSVLPPIDLSEQDNKPDSYKAARIEELMDTLECPVCLDTADTPPVYQCPEGHLICKVVNTIISIICIMLQYCRTATVRWLSALSVAML